MLELLLDPHAWAALVTLTALEVVLGIDNVVFISILVSRCSPEKARQARQIGLSLAFIFRVLMLEVTWRDDILVGGGLFLIAKATHEIHSEVEAEPHEAGAGLASQSFFWIVVQLIALDLIFSLDSIITAIGMVRDIEIMIAAIVIAMIVMYLASGPVTGFIAEHPTTKMLALAFLMLIGVALVADGFEVHIPRGYIYFAMAFAGMVEFFNVLVRRRRRRSGVS
jgi:predicted tellurium resistance membrane protein TerC